MKKRKSPIVLVSILGVAVLAAAVMNYKPAGTEDGHDHGKEPPKQETKPLPDDVITGKPRETPDASQVFKDGKKTAAKMPRVEAEGPEGEEDPSILEPEQIDYKPTPSDNSTSAHWFDKESSQGKGSSKK